MALNSFVINSWRRVRDSLAITAVVTAGQNSLRIYRRRVNYLVNIAMDMFASSTYNRISGSLDLLCAERQENSDCRSNSLRIVPGEAVALTTRQLQAHENVSHNSRAA